MVNYFIIVKQRRMIANEKKMDCFNPCNDAAAVWL